MITTYRDMKVFASFDKTQCGLEIAMEEGYFLTTEMERDEFNSPVLIQGPVDSIKNATDKKIAELYQKIKDEKFFIILTNYEDS